MEKFNCLICNQEMETHNKIAFIDYSCKHNPDDHHLSWRVKDNRMIKLRIRFDLGQRRLCMKVHYDENYTEVWTSAKSTNRLRINQIVIPQFEDIEKLKSKIKTLLVFA